MNVSQAATQQAYRLWACLQEASGVGCFGASPVWRHLPLSTELTVERSEHSDPQTLLLSYILNRTFWPEPAYNII